MSAIIPDLEEADRDRRYWLCRQLLAIRKSWGTPEALAKRLGVTASAVYIQERESSPHVDTVLRRLWATGHDLVLEPFGLPDAELDPVTAAMLDMYRDRPQYAEATRRAVFLADLAARRKRLKVPRRAIATALGRSEARVRRFEVADANFRLASAQAYVRALGRVAELDAWLSIDITRPEVGA